MKTASFLFYLMSTSICLNGQKSIEGIYLSIADLRNNKISFTPVNGKKYKIILNEYIFYKPTISIIIGDSIYTLHKDSFFGYRDRENVIHRFYGKTDFELLNPQEPILLYRSKYFKGYKGTQSIITYSFSPIASTKVLPLTLWNLKKSFPNDSIFHELLDIYFKYDEDLSDYDSTCKIFKLNRVYQLSKEFIVNKKYSK